MLDDDPTLSPPDRSDDPGSISRSKGPGLDRQRLREDQEPVDRRLARLRRITWALTIVSGMIGCLFVALFSAFGRPEIGLIVAGLIVGPIIGSAWRSDLSTHRLAARNPRNPGG